MAAGAKVVVQQVFRASAEMVYDGFMTPAAAKKFLFSTPKGTMVLAENEARVGGRYTFVDQRDGVDVLHTGMYLELERPRAIVFTLSVPMFSPVETTIALDIEGEDEGCVLTLTHTGVIPEFAERTKAGWGQVLGRATKVLGR